MSIGSVIGNFFANLVGRGTRTAAKDAAHDVVRMEADRAAASLFGKEVAPGIWKRGEKFMMNGAAPNNEGFVMMVEAEFRNGKWGPKPRPVRPRPAPAPRPRPEPMVISSPPLPTASAELVAKLGLKTAPKFEAMTRQQMIDHARSGKPVLFTYGDQTFLATLRRTDNRVSVMCPTDDVGRAMFNGKELVYNPGSSTVQSLKSFDILTISRTPKNRVLVGG